MRLKSDKFAMEVLFDGDSVYISWNKKEIYLFIVEGKFFENAWMWAILNK